MEEFYMENFASRQITLRLYPTNDRARQINPMATPEKQLSELSTKCSE